jgi:GTP1/Obg family GTP-binding protein
MFDSVSSHISLKIKEKVWTGEYIDMSLMLKSGKDLVYDSQLNEELAVKGGQLTVLQQKHNQIKNIHTWTSAFINFMSIMLEKWPGKAQVHLKYMHVIRLVVDMSELKSLCLFLSHSVKKGLSKSKIVSSFLRGRYI